MHILLKRLSSGYTSAKVNFILNIFVLKFSDFQSDMDEIQKLITLCFLKSYRKMKLLLGYLGIELVAYLF